MLKDSKDKGNKIEILTLLMVLELRSKGFLI